MNTEPDPQLDALFRAARSEAPDTARAEFGFEARLMARLREERGAGIFAWAWKLAPFFAAVALAAGWWGQLSMAQVESLGSLSAVYTLTDADQVNVSNPANTWRAQLPLFPVHGSVRNFSWFDGHVETRKVGGLGVVF